MMDSNKLPEVWLRGPLDGIPALLQPVAHALLQAQEELHVLLQDLPPGLLWKKPGGVAAPGFHLQHKAGVLDRLFTYAAGQMLSNTQLDYLAREGTPVEDVTPQQLLAGLDAQIAIAIDQLKQIDPETLTAIRGVGRKQVPSTVLGLLFHAAEHTMRHTGQLLVTVQVLKHNQVTG